MKLPSIKVFLELSKIKITVAVALTTITGYLLAGGSLNRYLVLPTLGIFLLACGSSAINHFQERLQDAKMDRTRKRPIPSGKISPAGALIFAFVLAVAGSVILYRGAGMLGMELGLIALIWYNAIYTPLKKKTAFAVVPGAVIGSIPPLVGWVAARGHLGDPRAIIMFRPWLGVQRQAITQRRVARDQVAAFLAQKPGTTLPACRIALIAPNLGNGYGGCCPGAAGVQCG